MNTKLNMRSAIAAFSIAAASLFAVTEASAQRDRGRDNRNNDKKVEQAQTDRRVERSNSRVTQVQPQNQNNQVYRDNRSWRNNNNQQQTYTYNNNNQAQENARRQAEATRQQQFREQQLRNQQLRDQQFREQQLRNQQLRDQQLRDQQVRQAQIQQTQSIDRRRQDEFRRRQNANVWQQQNDRVNRDAQLQSTARIRMDRSQQQILQRDRWNQYNSRWGNWQNIERQREWQLEQQRRNSYLRYQQQYWNRIRQDQLRLQQFRYLDNYYNNYRYNRGGSWYYTSQYGAQMLREAVNNGYEAGYYAGQADRNDGWQFDPQNSYGYQDAAYGYDSYYVSMDEYNYYFREGFTRGYEDGYYGRYRYGSYSNGRYSILGSIIGSIFDAILY